jgi:hypothetical protein
MDQIASYVLTVPIEESMIFTIFFYRRGSFEWFCTQIPMDL